MVTPKKSTAKIFRATFYSNASVAKIADGSLSRESAESA